MFEEQDQEQENEPKYAPRCKPSSFINVEPGALLRKSFPLSGNMKNSIEQHGQPCMIISFGEDTGPIEEIALTVKDSQELLIELLKVFSSMGDKFSQHALSSLSEYMEKQEFDSQDFEELDDNN